MIKKKSLMATHLLMLAVLASQGASSGLITTGMHRYARQANGGSHGDCGENFPCKNSTQCLPQHKFCDTKVDCENGADENPEECEDKRNQRTFNLLFGTKNEDSSEEEEEEELPTYYGNITDWCASSNYSKECGCDTIYNHVNNNSIYVGLDIQCQEAGFESFPEHVPKETVTLNLARNNIREFDSSMFMALTNLIYLDLSYNQIQNLHPNTFSNLVNLENLILSDRNTLRLERRHFANLTNLQHLDISRNKFPEKLAADLFRDLRNLQTLEITGCGITQIHTGSFRYLNKLQKLILPYNKIGAITQGNMEGLTSLIYLDFSNNEIRFIESGAFQGSVFLSHLKLHKNSLDRIHRYMFPELVNLREFLLDSNMIEFIEANSFANLKLLTHITLSSNTIQNLTIGMFEGLEKVTTLSLRKNKIAKVELGSFEPVKDLSSLDLMDNHIMTLPRGIFAVLTNLDYIHFDEFYLCGYAPNVQYCFPKSNGLSTVENLLGSKILRIAVWLVAILASVGNLLVLIARCVIKEENRVHNFFIVNLALSDFLMGVYLLIVAVHDVMYRGEYIRVALEWRSSWMCKVSGAFSLLSSEMSVFTLTVITADRFICIVHPFKFRNRNIASAASLMCFLWAIGLVLAALPILHHAYFGEFFYGANGVCLPLQFDRPFAEGWVFSLFVFVIANFISFTFIAYAYVRMFSTVRKSNLATRSTKVSQDWALMKRFTVIVATDFFCWMPIIIVKLLTYGGIQISPTAHAWFAVFVLPVNSAINPILYTMTTRQFKHWLLCPSCELRGHRSHKKKPRDSTYTGSVEVTNTISRTNNSLSLILQLKNGLLPPGTPSKNQSSSYKGHDSKSQRIKDAEV